MTDIDPVLAIVEGGAHRCQHKIIIHTMFTLFKWNFNSSCSLLILTIAMRLTILPWACQFQHKEKEVN